MSGDSCGIGTMKWLTSFEISTQIIETELKLRQWFKQQIAAEVEVKPVGETLSAVVFLAIHNHTFNCWYLSPQVYSHHEVTKSHAAPQDYIKTN